MSPPAPSEEPFSLADVLTDSLASLREDIRAHAGWSLIWIALALTTCCGTSVLIGGIGAVAGVSSAASGGRPSMSTLMPLVALVYLIVIPVMLALYAMQQAVVMDIVRARGRGSPTTMRQAIEHGVSRVPALLGHMALRLVFEGVPLVVVYAIVAGVVFASAGEMGPGMLARVSPVVWVLVAIVYVLLIVAAFAYRAFYGLAFPCIVDGAGPYAAFGASRALLAGRRMQFVGFRVTVTAVLLLSQCVCMGPYFVATYTHPGDPSAALVTLPLLLGFYAVLYFILVLDGMMEAAFHVRVTRGRSVNEIAKTFE